jgi:hypothetical protein
MYPVIGAFMLLAHSPTKASFRKFFSISNHSTEYASLSLNPLYITRQFSVIFNTVGSLYEGNLAFTVKVSSLQQKQGHNGFSVYAFSSLRND